MDLFSPLGILPCPLTRRTGDAVSACEFNIRKLWYIMFIVLSLRLRAFSQVLLVLFLLWQRKQRLSHGWACLHRNKSWGNLVHYSASHKRSYISRSLCCGELEQISSKWQYETAGCKIWIMLISHYVDLINIFWLSTTKQYIWSNVIL